MLVAEVPQKAKKIGHRFSNEFSVLHGFDLKLCFPKVFKLDRC